MEAEHQNERSGKSKLQRWSYGGLRSVDDEATPPVAKFHPKNRQAFASCNVTTLFAKKGISKTSQK